LEFAEVWKYIKWEKEKSKGTFACTSSLVLNLESLLGPQLHFSYLALTALQPPQCAETNICQATLKTTALELFGLTANKQIKEIKNPKETKTEPIGGNFTEST